MSCVHFVKNEVKSFGTDSGHHSSQLCHIPPIITAVNLQTTKCWNFPKWLTLILYKMHSWLQAGIAILHSKQKKYICILLGPKTFDKKCSCRFFYFDLIIYECQSTLMWSVGLANEFHWPKNDDSSYEKCPSLIFRQKCKKDSKKKTGAYTEKNKSRKTRLQFIHIV